MCSCLQGNDAKYAVLSLKFSLSSWYTYAFRNASIIARCVYVIKSDPEAVVDLFLMEHVGVSILKPNIFAVGM